MNTTVSLPAALADGALTMSSLEIAERTEKRHDNVARDIRHMLKELHLEALNFEGYYTAENGKRNPCFHLPKDLTLTLVAGYSIPLRKRIIDRWIELEGRAAAAPTLPAAVAEQIERTFGISRTTIHKLTEMERTVALVPALIESVNALVALVQPNVPGLVVRRGKTAGQILVQAGFTNMPKTLAKWFGNRLEKAGCRVEGKSESGLTHARLFDPDRAEVYLDNGGRVAVEKKIAERRGQGRLRLDGRASGQRTQIDRPGPGLAAFNFGDELVWVDLLSTAIGDGEVALMVTSEGKLLVDGCRNVRDYAPFGIRTAITAPRTIERDGQSWKDCELMCAVVGKVVSREPLLARPPLTVAVDNTTRRRITGVKQGIGDVFGIPGGGKSKH